MRELDFIEWICSRGGLSPAEVPIGPGDDCAEVVVGGEKVLVTADQVLDGVHLRLERDGPEATGRKAMARNLSDIAAMAALPVAAVSTVALPRSLGQEVAQRIYLGMRSVGDQYHCPLVGGDVAIWDGPLLVSVTVLGRSGAIRPVLRSGARLGDVVMVTGRLGGAWRSQRHLTFTPRIHEARTLACRYHLNAMIDLSDGLTTDLTHICRASGVAAEVYAPQVPIHDDARTHSPEDPLSAALNDGEDYELLFTVSGDVAEQIQRDRPLGGLVTRIGTIVGGGGLTLVGPDGRREPLAPGGWEHRS